MNRVNISPHQVQIQMDYVESIDNSTGVFRRHVGNKPLNANR